MLIIPRIAQKASRAYFHWGPLDVTPGYMTGVGFMASE